MKAIRQAEALRTRAEMAVLLALGFCLLGSVSRAYSFAGGTGEPNDPYQIATAEQLIAMGADPNLLSSHFVLIADIDLDPNLPGGKVFTQAIIAPLWPQEFTGSLDGGGHVIQNLAISAPNAALFAWVGQGGTVKNLGLDGVRIAATRSAAAVAVANEGSISSCYSTGSVRGGGAYYSSGGLVADLRGTLSDCHSSANVRGVGIVGGLAGTSSGLISACYATGSVVTEDGLMGYPCAGGLVGFNSGMVSACYAAGGVMGLFDVGGLVGASRLGTISSCHASGNVDGGDHVGGLVGRNEAGWVLGCYSTGVSAGYQDIGGLVGYNYDGWVSASHGAGAVTAMDAGGGLVGNNRGTVSNCFSSGTVTGTGTRTGGLVGENDSGWVMNCYSTGAVTGDQRVGGLAGTHGEGLLANCYSTGVVTGEKDVGGLVGYTLPTSGIVQACYWDIQTSGQAQSVGGTGLATSAMQTESTFLNAGWDFAGESGNGTSETWQTPDGGGYPVLSGFTDYRPVELKGQGTPAEPYLISTAADLGAIVWYDPNACYRLTADVDLSGIQWSMAVVPLLQGTLDGGGHAIRDLRIVGRGYLGLFGRVESGARVLDVGVVDVTVIGEGDYVGGLVGRNDGALSNCHSAGTIAARNIAGGLAGYNRGTVSDCYSTGLVSGEGGVGGLVGYNWYSVSACYSTCTVTAADSVGGLVGEDTGWVSDCSSTGPVTGRRHVGGLVGWNMGWVSNCRSTGSVTGSQFVGGLAGTHGVSLVGNCYSTGVVTGETYVGGLVGYTLPTSGAVQGCYWDIQTSGQTQSDGGAGLATSAMQRAATFLDAGWDFDTVWTICEGKDYPTLRWEDRSCQ